MSFGLTILGMIVLAFYITEKIRAYTVKALMLFFIGSVLFALSDLVLSGTYFGVGKERPVDIASNYILYYAGQFLIALSLAFL